MRVGLLALFSLAISLPCEVSAAPDLAPKSEQADAIRVFKSMRRMELLRDGKVLRGYRIALGDAPVGHSASRVTSARRKAITASLIATRIAVSICRCGCRIPTNSIANKRESAVSIPVATS